MAHAQGRILFVVVLALGAGAIAACAVIVRRHLAAGDAAPGADGAAPGADDGDDADDGDGADDGDDGASSAVAEVDDG